MATAEATAPDAHHDHDHPEWLAHHFETTEQQFDAGKLGMWLFLAQEVLFFSGLFVAYTVYRANHPEVFIEAHHFLNPVLGALNTIVLLASSLAVAWAVRAAQKNQQATLLWMHIFTLACAGFFLGVKVVEYGYKFDEGLFWAGGSNWSGGLDTAVKHLGDTGLHTHFFSLFVWSMLIGVAMTAGGWAMFRSSKDNTLGRTLCWLSLAAISWNVGVLWAAYYQITSPIAETLLAAVLGLGVLALIAGFIYILRATENMWGAVAVGLGLTIVGMAFGVMVANGVQQIQNEQHAAQEAHGADHATDHAAGHDAPHEGGELTADQHARYEDANEGGLAVDPNAPETAPAEAGAPGPADTAAPPAASTESRPANAGNFFSIYFAMTGVHAIHIIAGIIAISWIVARIARGDFGPERYGPVEYTGLYWHLVDLVWIYLFPLLYLIR